MLSNVLDNDVVKEAAYDELVNKVNTIDAIDVSKNQSKKLITIQKLKKLKREDLTMIHAFLLMSLISVVVKYLME